jgi:hypothetical protein
MVTPQLVLWNTSPENLFRWLQVKFNKNVKNKAVESSLDNEQRGAGRS